MARKNDIETLRKNCFAARMGFINAQAAYRAAEAALNAAERAEAKRKARQPRHEYAVLLIDEHGDAQNSCFADTLADARKEAVRWIGSDEGVGTVIVGTVIERVRLSDGERTTVEWHGQVSAGWRGEFPENTRCDGCEGDFPVDEVEVMGDAEHGQFGYCAACRAKDAKAAHG